MSRASAQVFSVSISDTASFLTRLRQISFSSSGVLAHARLGAVELERLIDGEVGLGLQQLQRVVDALAVAHLEAVEHREHRFELAGDHCVVQLVAEALELGDVAGEEVAAPTVQLLLEAVQHQRGHRIVDRRLAIVRALDHVADELADATLALGRGEILGIGCRDRLGDWRLRRAGEQTAHHEQCRQTEQERRAAGAGGLAGRFGQGRLIHWFTSSSGGPTTHRYRYTDFGACRLVPEFALPTDLWARLETPRAPIKYAAGAAPGGGSAPRSAGCWSQLCVRSQS